MLMRFFLFTLLIINVLFFIKNVNVRAEVVHYTVGDEEGWNSGTNFDSWSHKYNFSVGDILVFKYVKEQHNVYEVMEGTYRSCDASSGVLAKYESGSDQIKLTQQKKYWFICNLAGHCLGGMRFNIEVKGKPSNSSSNGESIPQMESTPPPNSSTSCAMESWTSWIYFLVLGIFFY